MYSRREFAKLALAVPAIANAAPPDVRSIVQGVEIGAQSYSFRDRPLDAAIQAMTEVGLGSCELWQGHIEPRGGPREELRKWRTTVSMEEYAKVRKKFDAAGIRLSAYNYSFREDFTDEEIARGFEMAKALGVKSLTASSNVTTAKRIDPFAAKARVQVGMHNHSNLKPNEFATPENFADAMRGTTHIVINLDIGHFTAANFDAVDYLKKNREKIVTLHIKDRKKNQGANVPFGEGDTPIKAVLQTLKTKGFPRIPANIEYEYKGGDTVVEVRKCFEYCKQALA
ncbi:MAG: TIM barrel protein [Bryobacteraceae bacterium]